MSVAFITGASGALGAAIAELFRERGWDVAGFDRAMPSGAKDDGIRHFVMDATSEESVTKAFTEAAKQLGSPRVMVTTVGGIKAGSLVADTSLSDFSSMMQLNVVTTFLASREAMRLMAAVGSGSIITIGAETALAPEAKKSGYVASKAAVIAFTRALAEEGKAVGVTANCLVPTLLRTKANEEWGSPEEIPKWTEPRDVAEMCFYLSSAPGAAINGAMIRIPNRM